MVSLQSCFLVLFWLFTAAQGHDFQSLGDQGEFLHTLDSEEATLRLSRSVPLDAEIHEVLEKAQIRKRRQLANPVVYLGPIVSDLYASQHCDGIYLRWKRPPHPISDGFYTHSEFQFYNVYRSTKYFTSTQGLSPYASGRDIYELRQLEKVDWLDPDPLTNDVVWYAVTMVTKDGKERNDITPAMAMYVGAFGASGNEIPLTSNAIKGNTLHHTAIFNPDRNEYVVAWDVDTNFDGKPDRIFCLRLSPEGGIVGRNILEITVKIKGNQGWPSIAYNPKSNEYLVVFQLSSLSLFSGKDVVVSQRIRPISLTAASNPSLLIKANDNKNGRTIPIRVIRPQVIYNRATGGYVTVAEMISFNNRHGVVISFSDATSKSLKLEGLLQTSLDARQCNIIYDTKRNELFIVAQLPNRAINKQGEVVPKLAYSLIVTKRKATGEAISTKQINMMGGETNLLDSSISAYYDDVKDRLMLFWNDVVNGKRVIKSSRVLLFATQHAVEFMDSNKKEICPTPTDVKHPYVAFFPSNGGQLVAYEQTMSGRSNIGGSLVRGDTFSFDGKQQRRPFLVTNEKKKEVLVLWQEFINSRQINLFATRVKAVSHRCISCSSPRTCIRDGRCVLPFKAKKPCAINNGGCSHTCLKSYSGSKCACRDDYKLNSDMKTCKGRGSISASHTYLINSMNDMWKVAEMRDGSMKYNRIPYVGRSLVALSYDTKNEMLYWSDVDSGLIQRGKLDGTDTENFVSNVAADGIAVDSESALVYWTDFKAKKIEVMRTNKQNRRVLVSTGLDKPRAISYCKHKGTRYIYWTDWGTPSKIERIQLDTSGTKVINRRVIVNYGLGWPNGLFAACDEGKIYWADAQYDKIDVSDLIGKNRRTLAGAEPKHPYSILIRGKSIYWTDWDGSLYRADKNTGLNQKQIIKTLHRPTALYIIAGKVRSSKVCSDPGTPRNGERKGSDFTEDGIVVFKCKSGYDLIGDSQIRCQSNGQWTERKPVCAEKRCPHPPRPLDGNRVVAGSSVGDGVVYTCNPGYKLVGKRVRMCLPGGKWAGSQPRCIAPLVFSTLPRNQTISFGSVGIIRCKVSTNSKISWLKDGRPFTVAETDTRIFVFKTSIFIQEARYSDSGLFTCQATNEAGTIKAHAQLRILGKKIPQCGQPKFTTRQRIIGGRVAGAGSHPWIAMLWSNKNKKLFCGGSLIAEQWVLTAAHCVPASMWDISDIRIKFGKTNSKRTEPHEQIKRVVKLYRHPKFNSDTFDSDIAVLKLDSPVVITDYVIPICLPYDDSDFGLLKTGVTAVISGWGSKNLRQVEKSKFSRKLLEVDVPVVDKIGCKKKMHHPVTENMFCAGAGERGDACKGDSGGPVTIHNTKSKKHVLVGIVSWGEGCGRKNTYGVYVKLYNFLAWVNSIAK